MPKYYSAKLSAADQVAPISHTAVLAIFPSHDPEWASHKFEAGIQELCRQLPWLSGYFSRGDQGYTHLTWRDDGQVYFERLDGSALPDYDTLARSGMKLHELPFDFRPTGMTTREDKESPIDFVAPASLWSWTSLKGGFVFSVTTHHARIFMLQPVESPVYEKLTGLDHLCDGTQAIIWNILCEVMTGRPATHVRDPLQPLTRYDTIVRSLRLEDPQRPKGDQHGEIQDVPKLLAPLLRGADGKTRPRPVAKDDQSIGKGNVLSNEIFSLPVGALKKYRTIFEETTGSKPSTILFVIALFWHLITAVRESRGSVLAPPPDDSDDAQGPRTTMVFPVSARPVFKKHVDLSESKYIGNLISGGVASAETSLLAAGPDKPLLQGVIEAVELLTGAAFTSMNPEWIKARLNLVLNIPDARLLVQPNTMAGNDMLATSWSHLDLYSDFGPGIGRPTFIRPAANKVMRTNRAWFSYVVILAPRIPEDGIEVLDVFTCFDAEDMAELKKQPLLQALLSTEGLSKARL